MTRSRRRKLKRLAANWAGAPLASAVFAYGGVAYAQQQPQAGGMLEEVVVTAQKRSEDLQKVPISLSVLSTEKLDQLEVKSFLDYAAFLPSVTFKSAGPGQSQVFFRGISTGLENLHAGYLPSSGLYLDETPVTTIAGALDVHVYDIARVEGLAGPQGTLYGASSLSGTLRMITNKPDPSAFSAGYDVTGTKFGKGDGGGSIEGFVNIPLSDHAAVRLVGFYEHDGGYISNVYRQVHWIQDNVTVDNAKSVKPNANTVDNSGMRAALKVDLNERWSVTPMLMAQYQKTNGDFAFSPKQGDLKIGDLRFPFNNDQWYLTSLTVNGKISDLDFVYSGSWHERKTDNLYDYSDYSLAYDFAYCNPIVPTACNPIYSAWGAGFDATQYTENDDYYTKMSHEVRLSSPADQRLRWVTGAFYQRQTDNLRAEFTLDGLAPAYWVHGQPNILYLSQQTRVDRDYAVFGDLTYDLTDKLKVSGGMRQFWVNNTLYGFFGYNLAGSAASPPSAATNGEQLCALDALGNPIYAPPGSDHPCVNTDKKVVESGETHRLNLTYQVDPDHMVYGTWSTGFRPGGNNRRPIAKTWRADTLANFEAGWKTAWFAHRLRFNGALFYERWKNAQTSIQGLQGITSIVNAGSAETKGMEFELDWLALDNLSIAASGTYVEAKITSDFCKPTPLGVAIAQCNAAGLDAPSGSQLPSAPKVKANLTARYKFAVGNHDNFVQAAVVTQTSSTYGLELVPNAVIGDTPAYTTFDLSAGTGMNNWKLEAYIHNAADRRGELGRISECNDPAGYCYQNYHALPIAPRNFGIRFGQKF